jgi:hypothetical protein
LRSSLTLAWLSSGSGFVVSDLHAFLLWVDFINIFGSYLLFPSPAGSALQLMSVHQSETQMACWLIPAYWLYDLFRRVESNWHNC